jgi:hypothetical protein
VAVVKVLAKYEVTAPGRRADAGQAANLVQDMVVYEPKPEAVAEFKELLDAGGSYELNSLAIRTNLLRLIDAKVSGFKDFMRDFAEARALSERPSVKDEAKTKEARAELQQCPFTGTCSRNDVCKVQRNRRAKVTCYDSGLLHGARYRPYIARCPGHQPGRMRPAWP